MKKMLSKVFHWGNSEFSSIKSATPDVLYEIKNNSNKIGTDVLYVFLSEFIELLPHTRQMF